MSIELFGNIAAFVLYLSMMIFIGWRYMKNNESSGDFFLGGRKVGPWMTALSAEASDMSGWLLMGLPGLAYLGGMKEAFWTALGLIIGTYLNWLIVAKPLRRFTVAYRDSITIPEFLTHRFRDRSRIISSVSVVLILVFFTIYTASGFVACAKLFSSVFGLSYHVGLIIGVAVILTYTILGGYLAVCATDFVQGLLMFAALVITVIVMTVVLGGPFAAFVKIEDFGDAAIAGTFGPLILLSLFWRGATAKGAIAGLITGGITVIVWHNLDGGLFAVYEILPAFLVCLLTAIAVSLFDKNKDPQMLAEFDSCRKEKN